MTTQTAPACHGCGNPISKTCGLHCYKQSRARKLWKSPDWIGPRYSLETGHIHSLLNDDYWRAMFRADYYRWAAARPFVGRDPYDGRQHTGSRIHRAAHRAANIAEARVWLDEARRLRASMTRDVLPK